MKRRSLILMIAIVLLPISLLTWFGVRMARDEQTLVQQRYRSLMEQRLQDVNRVVAQRFDETERRLQQITSINEFDLTELRAVVRREPQVTQLFVLSPEGELLYPNPADPLNGTEQSFLRQASRMFTDRDLQNAVALAESGTLEQKQLAMNRLSDNGRRTAGSRAVVSAPPAFSRSGDQGEVSPAAGAASQQGFVPPITMNDLSIDFGGNDAFIPPTADQTQRPGSFLASSDAPADAGVMEQNSEKSEQPTEPLMTDHAAPSAQRGRSIVPGPAPSISGDESAARSLEELTAPATPDPAMNTELAEAKLTDDKTIASARTQVAPDVPAQTAPGNMNATAPQALQEAMQAPTATEDRSQGDLASQLPNRMNVDPFEAGIAGSPVPYSDLTNDAVDAMAFQQNALEANQSMAYPESRGWFVWYWDRGMNLVYWQRRPSGHIVGAALERARWISDLISWLPESDSISKDSASVDTAFRVVTSSVDPVYRWGSDFELEGPPYCEVPLASPLASWRLQCFVPETQLAGGRTSALFGLGSGIAAFAFTLCGLAWFLYRDYARDMREASQQVSFVNQVSHELKTPLTNIRMYAELLERDLSQVSDEQSKKPLRRLEIINAEAQRLSRLIGNVLTFARQRRKTLQISPAMLDPVNLVASISERFQPSLEEKSIELQLEGDSGTTLNLDADFVEQILGNLISNVEKYAASGKLLKIRTACSDSDVTIDVIDAGPGIPSQFQSSVFEPFERLNNDLRASTGTGIGLSIARDLARLHGGDLILKASDNGCWFQCRLSSIHTSTAT